MPLIVRADCAFTIDSPDGSVIDPFGRTNEENPAGLNQKGEQEEETEKQVGPTGLAVTTAADSADTLTWDDRGDDFILSYTVYRRNVDLDTHGNGRGAAKFKGLTTTGSADTTFTDPSVTFSTRNTYPVTGNNAPGES